MLLLIKKIDKTYGGYDYIEVDTEAKVYAKGNSRAHKGHGSSVFAGGTWLEVAVATNKALKASEEDLVFNNFVEVDNMYDFHIRPVDITQFKFRGVDIGIFYDEDGTELNFVDGHSGAWEPIPSFCYISDENLPVPEVFKIVQFRQWGLKEEVDKWLKA